MSVFETIGVVRGRLLLEEEHCRRFSVAANELLGIGAEDLWLEALALAGPELSEKTGVLRIYASAGDGGLVEAVSAPGGWALFEELPLGSLSGLRLHVSRAPATPSPGGWKTGNYWSNLRALVEARNLNCDEAVVCNWNGEVVGAACANLFFVSGGKLLTPACGTGARDGAVRSWVLQRYSCEETVLGTEIFHEASECFLTNSRLGIASVVEIEGRRLPCTNLAEELSCGYRDEFYHD